MYRAVVPAKSLVALTFPLTGKVPEQSTVSVRQFFSPAVLTEVTATQPSTQKIAIPAAALQKATRARLRIVVERLAEGEGVALINGKEYRLPKAVTPENAPWIRDLPVAVADFKEQTEVKFQVTSPAHAGYRLATASVLVPTVVPAQPAASPRRIAILDPGDRALRANRGRFSRHACANWVMWRDATS